MGGKSSKQLDKCLKEPKHVVKYRYVMKMISRDDNQSVLGLVIAMSGVGGMLFLYFKNPENVLKPTWILFFGLAIAGWGEWQKSQGK